MSLLVMNIMETAVRKESETVSFQALRKTETVGSVLGMESQRDSLPSVLTQGKSPNTDSIHPAGILGYLLAGELQMASRVVKRMAFEDGEVSSRDADFVG